MKTVIVVLLIHLAINTEAQTPGKDSLYLMGKTSMYSSTNMKTGSTRGSSNVEYYYKLGQKSSFIKVKGTNYKEIVDLYPGSSRKYHQCIAQVRQGNLLGASALVLTGTFIAGTIIGGKNISSNPSKGFIWLGVGAVSLAGVFILPKLARKKMSKAILYFEESADLYNASLKK